jgi:hypothetical protein
VIAEHDCVEITHPHLQYCMFSGCATLNLKVVQVRL